MALSFKPHFNAKDRKYIDEVGKIAWDNDRIRKGEQELDIQRLTYSGGDPARHTFGTETDSGRTKISCTIADFIVSEDKTGGLGTIFTGRKRFVIYDYEAKLTDLLVFPSGSQRFWDIKEINYNSLSGRCEIVAEIRKEPTI